MPLGSERFIVFGSGVAEHYHERWFVDRLDDWHGVGHPTRSDASAVTCRMEVLGRSLCGLSIAGPRARDVLAELVDDDVSNEAFRFLDIREAWVDMAPAIIGRVTYTGDLGYEIWMDAELQPYVFDRLMEVGERVRHPAVRRACARLAAPGEELRRVGDRVPADLHAAQRRARLVRQGRQG